MQAELSPSTAAVLERVMASGRFESEQAAVDEAFRLLQTQQDAFEAFQKSLDESIALLDRGEGISLDEMRARIEKMQRRSENERV